MNKPYIICHMVTSIDGKVTGSFLSRKEAIYSTNVYYNLNRKYQADAYLCGRTTMQGSFTNYWYPNLDDYSSFDDYSDYIVNTNNKFYAIALDPHARLGWKSNLIDDPDHDPGYDKATIIEILSHNIDTRYLSYLRKNNISYVFGGEDKIDLKTVLDKLYNYFGIKKILLEGGSITNSYFLKENLVDELSLVIDPVIAETSDLPLFYESIITEYQLKTIEKYNNNVLWLNYIKSEVK